MSTTQRTQPGLPALGSLLGACERDERIQEAFAHNVDYFKHIHGGLALALRHRIEFDPRDEFWRRPERRLLVSYFAKRWHRRYAPVDALRRHAMQVFTHLNRGRADGLYDWYGVDYHAMGGWPEIATGLAEQTRRLAENPAYAELRATWSLRQGSAAEHLLDFINETVSHEDWPAALEPSFSARLPWFPYLTGPTEADLASRQAFFFGYLNLLTSNNAYRFGAALSFASVIQNTPASLILDQILDWQSGRRPDQAGFMTMAINDDELVDRSHYAPVGELYGFVRLDSTPFINNRSRHAYEAEFGELSHYDLADRAGELCQQFLADSPESVSPLAELFTRRIDAPIVQYNVVMEGLDSSRAERRVKETDRDRVDSHLMDELYIAAKAHTDQLSPEQRASCALHLLLDAEIYARSLAAPEADTVSGEATVFAEEEETPPDVRTGRRLVLPPGLRDAGEKALRYLRAGVHVLFAGAPGTGKTTLAQIVGHAWDHDLNDLPDEIDLSQSPMVTVGNSAWSPFHTIGGLRPRPDGTFEPHRGIFIDIESPSVEHWQLKPCCIVLDEMNRADLDRCIGELYPLLSGSVDLVYPAGIPGVATIRVHPRFRVIATVNDATLDDVVFPISEGLARRFQRIELLGATEQDLLDYLGVVASGNATPRQEAAAESVRELISTGIDDDYVRTSGDAERLPFGAGYFALLKRWVDGELEPSPAVADLPESAQATWMLRDSLSTLTRDAKLEGMLERLIRDD